MKTIRILHMYSDMLDLYGDNGNIEVLSYRAKARGIETAVEHHALKRRTVEIPSCVPVIYIILMLKQTNFFSIVL